MNRYHHIRHQYDSFIDCFQTAQIKKGDEKSVEVVKMVDFLLQ